MNVGTRPWLLGIVTALVMSSSLCPAHAQRPAPPLLSEVPTTLWAAGDIARCNGEDPWWEEMLELVGYKPQDAGEEKEVEEPFLSEFLEILHLREETDHYANAEKTAMLLHGSRGKILALGDLAYPSGSRRSFNECYKRTWGSLKRRTYPVPGNHEYKTKDAWPYFEYWGPRAGEAGKGYYSFDLDGWHIIALNSKLEKRHYQAGLSAQHRWLQKDLAATTARCLLAYWHHPVFSSGRHGGSSRMKNMLKTLYKAGVSVVLTGHDHDYERFAPQDPHGVIDPSHGFRAFVVGTGGVPLRPLETREKNSEFFQAATFGVLKLELAPDRYAWEFLPVGGAPPLDAGSGSCVRAKKG